MYRNYFYLNRFVIELNDHLSSHKIRSIYSQEKEKLIIECAKDFEERFFIEICVNPGHPYITVKDDFRRARKNVTDLFPEILQAEISDAEISLQDRIIRINTSKGHLYFLLRGKYTNFILYQSDNLNYFKHHTEASADDLISELGQNEFTGSFNFPSFNLNEEDDLQLQVKKKHPYIGKEILLETMSRLNDINIDTFTAALQQVILDILEKKPVVCADKISKEVHIVPETFDIFQCSERTMFDSYMPALNHFLSKKFYYESLDDKEKTVSKVIEKELNRITLRLDKIRTRIENGSKEELYNKNANLLLINRHLLKKGMSEIQVEDIYSSGENVKIKLDPSKSPQQNIDALFEKAKDERVSYEKSLQMHSDAEKQFQRLLSVKEKFNSYTSTGELESIIKELKIKEHISSSGKDDLKSKFKQYVIDKNYNVFVGKDSKNNDLLTTKFARQNDYWFHARSVSGSHVILKVDDKMPVPKNILKKAASLAAYHSKAKTAGLVPVSFTFKKYVVKKKGMETGKVALMKEDVLLVRPEIPEGAEYIINE